MTVKIHGKEYKTVAERVNEFREHHPDWTIKTQVSRIDDDAVVVKASIKDAAGHLIATGYAEEFRTSSKINQTSALENAETSAVGRALAFFGMGGTEIASADEVANAINEQQVSAVLKGKRGEFQAYFTQMLDTIKNDQPMGFKELYEESKGEPYADLLWKLFDSNQTKWMREAVTKKG